MLIMEFTRIHYDKAMTNPTATLDLAYKTRGEGYARSKVAVGVVMAFLIRATLWDMKKYLIWKLHYEIGKY